MVENCCQASEKEEQKETTWCHAKENTCMPRNILLGPMNSITSSFVAEKGCFGRLYELVLRDATDLHRQALLHQPTLGRWPDTTQHAT